MGSFGVASVHTGAPFGRRDHSSSLGFHSFVPCGRRVHSGSLGFTGARKDVAGFIRVSKGSLVRANRSSGSFRFVWVHFGAPRTHSGSRGFTRTRLVVAGFIRVRLCSFRCA